MSTQPPVPSPAPSTLPMSFAQERMWFLSQLEPSSHAYNISRVMSLTGALDTDALGRSLREIVRRHEALRTTFRLRDGKPVQVIHPDRDPVLVVETPAAVPASARRDLIQETLRAEATRPFDLLNDPAARFRLLQLGDDEHILQLTVHHIVWDGPSAAAFFRELAELYDAFRRGRTPALPDLTVQYGDYAVWQRERLQGVVLDQLLGYWRTQLAGAPPVLELPSDRARPSIRTHAGAVCRMEISDELSRRIQALAREERVTPFVVLLAAFTILLQRYSAQDDVVVGTPISSRTRKELEPLIGMFLNTLVLRTDLSGNPSVRELLGRARRVCFDAYAHQELPFEKLVETLKPERRLQTQPLFQVMFAFQHAPVKVRRLADLQCDSIEVASGTAKFDLYLYVEQTATGLAGSLSYDTDLFNRATVERMRGHFVRILTSLVQSRDRRIGDIALLTDEERAVVIGSWQGPPAVPAARTIQEPIEAQAALRPDAIAVRHGGVALTYAELDRRANQLAHDLRRRGVGPEVRVGICLERSPELVVALLGVLKAGGAYVPLDPAYPEERLRYMVGDSRAGVVLSQKSVSDRVGDLGVPIVRIDSDWKDISLESRSAPAVDIQRESLAYVIYTSGSTGQPKGVAIEHRSTSAFLRWAIDSFSDGELRAVLASTSICFDLSVFELFAPLCCGGTVVLCQSALDVAADPAAASASLVNTVPSAMVEILRLDGCPASAITINLAGEPLQRSLVEALYARPGVEKVINLYGPSEDTTYSTWACIPSDEHGAVSIGRPVAGTQAYVVDDSLELVPIGIPGELLIGGHGLARGYLDRPDMTAAKFVPNPIDGRDGDRLYRTGDLARWLPGGELDFLGRFDHQVKLRGFRIELGEIEEALCRHPRVRQAAAAVADLAPNDRRLVAYLVFDGEPWPAGDDMRSFLKPRLPEHLIPSLFVGLDSMPMTPNGKVDRHALPAPAAASSGQEYVAPGTPLEQALSRIWTEILRVDRVGLRDDFFELGGHSLLAVQVLSRIREVLRIDLPLHVLFEKRTLLELAAEAEHAIREVLLQKVVGMRQEVTVAHGV